MPKQTPGNPKGFAANFRFISQKVTKETKGWFESSFSSLPSVQKARGSCFPSQRSFQIGSNRYGGVFVDDLPIATLGLEHPGQPVLHAAQFGALRIDRREDHPGRERSQVTGHNRLHAVERHRHPFRAERHPVPACSPARVCPEFLRAIRRETQAKSHCSITFRRASTPSNDHAPHVSNTRAVGW